MTCPPAPHDLSARVTRLVSVPIAAAVGLAAGIALLGCGADAMAAGSGDGRHTPMGRAGDAPLAQSLTLVPCQLEDPLRLRLVQAECVDWGVPENPAVPLGRQISLHIARVPAINRRKLADPLFILAGGPGQSATALYPLTAGSFERIHRDRDIVLLDQRGTGRSHPLHCALNEDDLYRATDAQVAAESAKCLRSLESKAAVAFYTTSIAVQDLDRLRAALGYERINLYGVSYGTRVAQHYLRRYPGRARTVILDGVVPPQIILGPAVAIDAQAALDRILERCARDPHCHERFGDPAVSYRKLLDSVQQRPVSVALSDPTSGRATKLDFGRYHLTTVLRLASYSSDQAALLPLILHQAAEAADFQPLAAQFLLMNRSVSEQLAFGMHNTVICSEDAPYFDHATQSRGDLEKTYLGTSQLDGLRSICSAWPRGPVDADFHAQLHSQVPVLLLSGSDDPVTPASYGEIARRGFTHSLHVVLQGSGHGQLAAPCVDHILGNFLNLGTVERLDVSCTRNDRPMPFFISLGGPSP